MVPLLSSMTGPYHDSTTPLNATNILKSNVHEKRSKKSKDDEIEKREENMSKKKAKMDCLPSTCVRRHLDTS